MAWLKRGRQLSWCINHRLRFLQQSQQILLKTTFSDVAFNMPCQQCRGLHSGLQASKARSSHQVRSAFIEYFKQNDHLHIPSSSIIPRTAEGTYFVNAGMSQFKPIFLGTVDPTSPLSSYRRAVNSQRCVRVGGKHNDLEDVGKDTSHHTFFEMLGSWSFGDYFKRHACRYAWELLTDVYGIPPAHLYVTYFAGDKQLGLDADLECRDIWREIGVPAERVVPSGAADNFWDMGETGPCGPCTEIHYAHSNSGRLSHVVNNDSTRVLEVWNIVFMQFDRQRDGSLVPLPRQHVDTGMGLERITAILQGQTSNYNTDLFTPIFKEITNRCSVRPYEGLVGADDTRGVDTAYRVVADHIRMATVAIADGLRPGNKDIDSKLKLILHRALRQARNKLRAPSNLLGHLVPIVIDTLGDAFPTTNMTQNSIAEMINFVEQKLWDMEISANKSLDRCLKQYHHPTALTAEQVLEVCDGRFGHIVSLDVVEDVCRHRKLLLQLDQVHEQVRARHQDFLARVATLGVQKRTLNQHQVAELGAQEVPFTDDTHKFNYLYEDGEYCFASLDATVVALVAGMGEVVQEVPEEEMCGVILDRTCFYAEGGGQVSDLGYLRTATGCHVPVSDVQLTSGYVLHTCQGHKNQLKVGDKVTIFIDQERRRQCMKNHTGTHLLNHALEAVLGGVQQQGSMVSPDKLTFDFSCSKVVLDSADIQKVSEVATDLVNRQLIVYLEELPLERALKVNGLRHLQDEVYPSTVKLVSIGAPSERLLVQTLTGTPPTHSAELCGGTHVHNTGDLEALVVVHVRGMTQGRRRVTAITGNAALQALENAQALRDKLNEVNDVIDGGGHVSLVQTRIREVEQMLGDGAVSLPKVDREAVQSTVDLLKQRDVNPFKNAAIKSELTNRLQVLLSLHLTDEPLVREFTFIKPRDLASVLYEVKPRVPVMLLTSQHGRRTKEAMIFGVCYVPIDSPGGLSPRKWAEYVATSTKGNQHAPHSKPGKQLDQVIHVLSIPAKNASMHHVHELAASYANLFTGEQS